MTPFIRAAEVWLPSSDHTALQFGAGLFGEAPGFADASRDMSFAPGQGLPGDAWKQGRPLLLKQLDGTPFRRRDAAKVAGLTCAVALPFFVGGSLTAVLVLLGSDDGASCTGALELWRNDPRISSDMTLVDGYYGGLPEAFEAISRDTFLPRGAGLPGLAWQSEQFVVMAELSASTRFLRGEMASDAGIRRGLAMPCTTKGHASYVLSLLSGGETPVVRRAERWMVDRAREQFHRVGGYCELQGTLEANGPSMSFNALSPADATALLAGTPALLEASSSKGDDPIAAAAHACEAQGAVCIPLLDEERPSEVAVLYL